MLVLNKKNQYKGKNLVFMVASPRSGTSWLQRMLIASTPRLSTGPESFLFVDYISPQLSMWDESVKNGHTNLQHILTRQEFVKKLRIYATELLEPMIKQLKDNEFFIEKTNSHALVLPAIQELFPESKIIHVVRDPRDVVASWLAASRSWGESNQEHSAHEFATIWKKCVMTAQQCGRKSSKNSFLEIRYENLLADTKVNLQRILGFLGIEVSPTKLDMIISSHTIENMKKGKGYKKLILKGDVGGAKGEVWQEPEGFFRKGKIGSWKEDLTLWEKYEVYRVTGSLMRELGYR